MGRITRINCNGGVCVLESVLNLAYKSVLIFSLIVAFIRLLSNNPSLDDQLRSVGLILVLSLFVIECIRQRKKKK